MSLLSNTPEEEANVAFYVALPFIFGCFDRDVLADLVAVV